MNNKQELELKEEPITLSFYAGTLGALFPFILFLTGVVFIALSGAPDERGFWPVIIAAMAAGLLLAKDRKAFCESVLHGMSDPLVMVMITAWILASCIGVLMTLTGLVEALSWIASQLQLNGPGFVVAAFMMCCLVSLSTGSSFATILICGPILYPAGGLIEAPLAVLAGAIIAGATFGDFTAPISDTTIASALSQKAEIGPTVKSRIKYIVPVVILALIAFFVSANLIPGENYGNGEGLKGDPRGLPMLLVPAFIIWLFLKGKHLMHGLLLGLIFGVVLGLIFGLLSFDNLLSLDLENFTAKSFIIDGINRAVGISFFTILLMGLVATLKASGMIRRLVNYAKDRSKTVPQSEGWIAGVVAAAVSLTTHSIVAVLMVAEFANETGEAKGISPRRRANILSMVVCVFPFLFPYFIPVILMANVTQSGADFGIPSVAPLQAGMYNFVAWGLAAMVLIAVGFGYGRKSD